MKKSIIAIGVVCGSLLSINGVYQTLPDEYQLASKAWHKERSDANDISDAAGSVKYHHQNICDEIPTDLVLKGQVEALYEELTQRPHPYTVMYSNNPDTVCEDIRLRRELRQKARSR